MQNGLRGPSRHQPRALYHLQYPHAHTEGPRHCDESTDVLVATTYEQPALVGAQRVDSRAQSVPVTGGAYAAPPARGAARRHGRIDVCMYALQGVHTRAANCMYRMGVLVLPMQVGSTVHLYYIDSG